MTPPAIAAALVDDDVATIDALSNPLEDNSSVAANDPLGRKIRVLSGEGCQFEADDDLKGKLCLTDDGILRVDPDAKGDLHVLSYMARLRRNNVPFREVEAGHSEIQNLYQRGFVSAVQSGETQKTTDTQGDVLRMVGEAAKLGASDIHIVIDSEATYVRYRIHGILRDRFEVSRDRGDALVATIYNSMCDMADGNREPHRDQNGRFKEVYSRRCGLYVARVATGPAGDGSHTVIRLYADNGDYPKSLLDLGYLPEQVELIETAMRRTSGMILISGTTGSGKTTTLANLLKSELVKTDGQICIITAEDPVEQPISVLLKEGDKTRRVQAQQKPVRAVDPSEEAVAAAWVKVIDHMLRSDPDIMMIGELRSRASIIAAVRGVLTGHLSLATIHAMDATTTLERLEDSGVERNLLTDPSLFVGLINQGLVSLLCPHCSKPFNSVKHSLRPDLVKRIEQYCTPDTVNIKGAGCSKCDGGVVGRTVCAEVIVPSRGFMDAYRERGKYASRQYWIERMDGITRCNHMRRLINSGTVCPDLAERVLVPLDHDDLDMVG